MKKDFYVYEWYNVNTNEIFYVGKGRKDRYKNILQRNNYFKNYYNKYKCDVRKVKTELEENEAFELEKELIEKYRKLGQCKCNLADGGDGCTFPEGSWNDLFRKLQYLRDIKGAMNDMPNEQNYDYHILKTKTLEELQSLYDKYQEFKQGQNVYKSLVYDGILKDNRIKLTKECMTELYYQDKEIKWLTDFISENVAKNNNKYKEFLTHKTEVVFYNNKFNTDKFIDLMLEDYDYMFELYKVIFNNIKLLQLMGAIDRFKLYIKIDSHYIEDTFIIFRIHTSESKKIVKVKVNIYDIIWGILMFDNKAIYQIIYDEIVASPIIN